MGIFGFLKRKNKVEPSMDAAPATPVAKAKPTVATKAAPKAAAKKTSKASKKK